MSYHLWLEKLAAATEGGMGLTDPSIMQVVLAVFVGMALASFISLNWMLEAEPTRVYPYILGLATGNPPYKVLQTDALKIALKVPGCDSIRGMLERLYVHTRIQSRHMAIPDFCPPSEKDEVLFNKEDNKGKKDDKEALLNNKESSNKDGKDEKQGNDAAFNKGQKGSQIEDNFFPADNSFEVPVEDRLRKFKECAVPLVTDVCRRAIEDSGVNPQEISKLVVVSSTGFIGPGLDCELIQELKLRRDMDRSLIGFMGCAAAMNGFRICNDYVRARPGKYALLCCVELSSVHTTFEDDANDAVLHAIFADGCAAAVIAGAPKAKLPCGTLAIVDDYAWLMEETQSGIVLSVNANGISCTLARKLPEFIKMGIKGYVDKFLAKIGKTQDDVDFWGVHPGGTRIIEEVQNGLGLTTDQTADSWAVLRQYGNMLSPSIMFVLQRVFARHKEARAQGKEGYKLGLAFSFSPGVGVEGLMLQQVA